MNRTLTPEGRPTRPGSYFIQFRAEYLKVVDFVFHLKNGDQFFLPVRFLGGWQIFAGTVTRINMFPDGMTVFVKPSPGGILNWPISVLWVSDNKTHGGVI